MDVGGLNMSSKVGTFSEKLKTFSKKVITNAKNAESEELNNGLNYFHSDKMYNISNPKNLFSNLEFESAMLISTYKGIKHKIDNGTIDLYFLSEEEIAILNTCKVSTFDGYYLNYLPIAIYQDRIILKAPEEYIVRNPDGTIDYDKSSRKPLVELNWRMVGGYLDFELISPLDALVSLAHLNPFFNQKKQHEFKAIMNELVNSL